jgi:hypothetical protein
MFSKIQHIAKDGQAHLLTTNWKEHKKFKEIKMENLHTMLLYVT